MAYKLIVSEEAHRDIDDIVHYIAVELANPAAAAAFLDDVETTTQLLITHKCTAYVLMPD